MPHRLLLADDSVTIQRVIELTFADEDIRVTAVGDGQQAIDRIAAEPPDIVLADVGMPGRDGYEVASFIKDRPDLSHIPVLLLTGAFEPVDEARARGVRCDGVLAKPFEPQLLIARVKELLARGPSPAAAVPNAGVEPPGSERPAPPADDDLVLDPRHMLEGAPPRSPEAETSLDDYFDRLDQAFANLAGTAAPPRDPSPRPTAELSWA
ncbi:MAG: response regulator, partial [Acidobacteria bacterium]